MIQVLHAGDIAKYVKFSNVISQDMEDDNFIPHLIFSNKATSLISSKVNCHNVSM